MTMQNIEGEKDPLTAKIEEVSQRPDHLVSRQYEDLLARNGDAEASLRVKATRLSFLDQVSRGRLQVARDELANNVDGEQPKP